MNAPIEPSIQLPVILKIADLIPSPTNPRTRRNAEADAALTESVRKNGVMQPITVRKTTGMRYEVVFGHRRFDAAKAAGLKEIAATVRDLTDVEVMEMQLIENHQREDVDELEEAVAFKRLMDLPGEDAKTADDIAEMIGMSRSQVYARLKLLDLKDDARQAFVEGKIDASTALLIARVPGKGLQKKAVQMILDGYNGEPLSYRTAKRMMKERFTLQLQDAAWDLADAKLCPKAGSCSACPKRSGNDETLLEDIGSPDVCTDPDCYEDKRATHYLNMRENAEKKGIKIISGDEARKIVPYGTRVQSSEYESLDAICFEDAEGRTYREILGSEAKPEAIVEAPGKQGVAPLIEVMTEGALQVALKKVGFVGKNQEETQAGIERREALQREHEEQARKTKIEEEYRASLFQQIRIKAGEEFAASTVMAPATLTAIAVNFFKMVCATCAGGGIFDRRALIEMWGHTWIEVENDREEEAANIEAFTKRIIDMDTPAVCLFLVDIGLIDETEVSWWQIREGTRPDRLEAEAARLGIDAAALRESIEKANAPTPPKAAKKAPTPKPAARAADKAKGGEAKTKASAKAKAAPVKAKSPAPAKPAKGKEKPTETEKAKAPTKAAKSAPAKPAKEEKTESPTTPKLRPVADWPFPTK